MLQRKRAHLGARRARLLRPRLLGLGTSAPWRCMRSVCSAKARGRRRHSLVCGDIRHSQRDERADLGF